uniref:Uncharacterized protein n=1 Tax=viral metagenome TaxID=1070528 RepID=A0A6C0KSG7_9ZZZZ
MNNQEEYYKEKANQYRKEAFSGQAQDLQAYDMSVYFEAQYKRIRIENLKKRHNFLWNYVYGPQAEAQDIDGMIEIEEIEEEIKALRNPDGHPSESFPPSNQ